MASRLSKLVSAVATAKKSWDDVFLKNMPMGESDSTILDNPYSKVDLVFTCISTTARAIAQVPLVVVQYNPSGTAVPVKIDHPWQQLINRPNYLMNRSLFIESIISYWLLDGNVCIIPYPYGSTAPISLWPVRWKNIKYTTDTNGHLAEWLYTAGLPGSTAGSSGNPLKFEPDEVVHLKFFNPDNVIDGLAPSSAGKLPILGTYKSAQYNQNFFDNGAVPGGVLQTEQRLQKDTVELVRNEFNQRHQGRGKAHKIAILSQGLSYQPMGITQKDMDFIELRKADRESIMQIYGMKKSIISVTETVNHACIPDSERVYTCDRGALPISQVEVGDLVWSFSEEGPVKRKVIGNYYQGTKLLYEIKTPHKSLRASYDHPVLVVEQGIERSGNPIRNRKTGKFVWKPIGEIKIGDYVVMTTSLPLPDDAEVNDDLCKFVGAFLGDGWYIPGGVALGLHEKTKSDLREVYSEIALKQFEYKRDYMVGLPYDFRKTPTTLAFYGTARDILTGLKIKGGCKNKELPQWAFHIGKDKALSLLRGFSDTDGSICKVKNGITFNSANEGLIKSVAALLDYIGIWRSNVGVQPNNCHTFIGELWRVYVNDGSEIGTDKDEFTLAPKKDRNLGANGVHPCILGEAASILPEHFTVERVKSIEELHEEDVWDLEVEDRHNFICNGIVVHNTATAERKEWWKGTCMPLMRMIMDCFNTFLFNKGREKLIFDISNIEALHEDFNDKVKTSDTLLRLGFTRNEVNARLELGFPEVEWGNYAYMPVNMMPVNIDGMGLFAPKPEPNDSGNPDEPGDDTPPGGTPNDNPDGDNDEKFSSTPLGKTMSNRISRAIFDYRSVTMRLLENGEKQSVHAMSVDMFSKRLLRLLDPIILVLIDETNEEDKLSHIAARYLLDLQKRLDDFFLALKSQVCNALIEGKSNKEIKTIFNKATKVADSVAEKEMQAAIDFRRVKNG